MHRKHIINIIQVFTVSKRKVPLDRFIFVLTTVFILIPP
jgi:hypothetical protein